MDEDKAKNVEAIKAGIYQKLAALRSAVANLKGAIPDAAALETAKELIASIAADAQTCGIAMPAVSDLGKTAEESAADDMAKVAVMEYEHDHEKNQKQHERDEALQEIPFEMAMGVEAKNEIAHAIATTKLASTREELATKRAEATEVAKGMGKEVKDTYLAPVIQGLEQEERRLDSIKKSHETLDNAPLAPEIKAEVAAIREERHERHEAYQKAREEDTALEEGLGLLFGEEPEHAPQDKHEANAADKLIGALTKGVVEDHNVSHGNFGTLDAPKITLPPESQKAINEMIKEQKAKEAKGVLPRGGFPPKH